MSAGCEVQDVKVVEELARCRERKVKRSRVRRMAGDDRRQNRDGSRLAVKKAGCRRVTGFEESKLSREPGCRVNRL